MSSCLSFVQLPAAKAAAVRGPQGAARAAARAAAARAAARAAIGSPGNSPECRVYAYEIILAGTWTQIGADILSAALLSSC